MLFARFREVFQLDSCDVAPIGDRWLVSSPLLMCELATTTPTSPNGERATVWSATQTDLINSSGLSVSHTNIYDGLGRTIHSELTSDPEGMVTVDTVYDGDGRVLKVSNPYRSGDTEYWTTNTYDGIGRITAVTKTDGSVATTAYSGNTTTVTDQACNQRKSQNDGIGRLTSVWENPASLNRSEE